MGQEALEPACECWAWESLSFVPCLISRSHPNRQLVPEWVHQQVYLHPYPNELMLHVGRTHRCI